MSAGWHAPAMTPSLRCEIFPSPADLDAVVAFYVDVLGFALTRDERAAEQPYVALGRGEVRVGAAARPEVPDREPRRPPAGVELVLEVDDLDADRARVAAAGWRVAEDITRRPWGLRDFRVLDPSGYYWRITERAGG
jgi:lactoylglutathione lyase